MILFILKLCAVYETHDYCNISSSCPYGVLTEFNRNDTLGETGYYWYRCDVYKPPANTSIWYGDKYNRQIWAMNIVSVTLGCIAFVAGCFYVFRKIIIDCFCESKEILI